MTILLFFIILVALVLVHEAGHFFAAKSFGIRVDEFGFGFPPRLISYKKGETRYSLNLIPFGGFVKIFGEDPTEEVKDGEERRNFTRKPRFVQAIVLVAGVFGNFLLAWFLISSGFISGMPAPSGEAWGVPVENAVLTIVDVLPDSPASRGGLLVGDKIIYLAQSARSLKNPSAEEASNFIAGAEPRAIDISVERKGEISAFSIAPANSILKDKQAIGIAMDEIGTVRLPFYKAFWEGGKVTIALTGETARALANFVRDAFSGNADLKNLAGPVGIANLVGEARAEGTSHILLLTALISINLAIINLIPFPALDGGRLLFVVIEAIRRKPISPKIAQYANAAGFIILLIFIGFVTAHDISRLFSS